MYFRDLTPAVEMNVNAKLLLVSIGTADSHYRDP